MKRHLILVAALVGCNSPWPLGEVCNQRDRILFAGVLANSDYAMCESHDYDDDRHDAAYDRDDRLDRYGEGVDGSRVGDIYWCRIDPALSFYADKTYDYDWDCVTAFWADQLSWLCEQYEAGNDEVFEYGDLEDEAYPMYCL